MINTKRSIKWINRKGQPREIFKVSRAKLNGYSRRTVESHRNEMQERSE